MYRKSGHSIEDCEKTEKGFSFENQTMKMTGEIKISALGIQLIVTTDKEGDKLSPLRKIYNR